MVDRIEGLGRLLGLYFATGAVLVVLWMVLPHPSGINDLGVVLGAVGMAIVGGVLLLVPGQDGMTPAAVNLALVTVTVSTSLVYYFSGRPGGTFILLYVWSAPFAFVLLRFREALAQTLLASAALLVVNHFRPQTLRGQHLSVSVIGVASVLAVSTLVHLLMRRLLVGQDERERLAARLARSERLESLGQLASGAAHDFNNLLATILNYAAFAVEEIPEDSPAHADVNEIYRAAERGVVLTQHLLAFARQETISPRALSLNDTVTKEESLLRHTLGDQVELTCELSENLWPVLADQGQLERVLLNVVINARDAMPGGGRLTIDTANQDIDEPYAAHRRGLSVGRWVRLQVSDTGEGMDAPTLQRAFDPFFTTKPSGQGTGLGLATIQGIIMEAGGYCELCSEPGQGTTFVALLPATEQAVEGATPAVPAEPLGGHETVLVAEDEPDIREITRRLLEARGYHVLLAADGTAAVEVIRLHHGNIDLLLTDVIMPGPAGRDLVDCFLTVQPNAKILFVSGYADSGGLADFQPRFELLQKPFSGPALLTKVREVLDG